MPTMNKEMSALFDQYEEQSHPDKFVPFEEDGEYTVKLMKLSLVEPKNSIGAYLLEFEIVDGPEGGAAPGMRRAWWRDLSPAWKQENLVAFMSKLADRIGKKDAKAYFLQCLDGKTEEPEFNILVESGESKNGKYAKVKMA